MNAEPMVPSWVWDTFVLCLVVVPFVALYIWALIEQLREARRRRGRNLDQATDTLFQRGIRAAWRRGWIQNGDE